MKRPPVLARAVARSLVPFGGSRAAALIPQARLSGPMPWVIAIMVALTTIAAAGGLALSNLAQTARGDLSGAATVQMTVKTEKGQIAKADAMRLEGAEVVFPGMTGKAMSNMTLLKVMRDMCEPYHVHGFRSTFTDWAANEGFPDAVVEAALAHKTPDAVQAAYRRTTYLGTPDQPGMRVKLMDAWGRYCNGVAADAGKTTPPE